MSGGRPLRHGKLSIDPIMSGCRIRFVTVWLYRSGCVCVCVGRRNKKRTTAAAMTDVNGDEQEDQEDSEPADTVATDNNVDDYDAGQ